MTRTPHIELVHLPGCPLVERVRAIVEGCLRDTGIAATVEQREGAFASPTLLIDGADVVTGAPAQPLACCRLDLPTRSHVLTALNRSRS